MPFKVLLAPSALESLEHLKADRSRAKRFKASSKALRLLEANPDYPGLNTHAMQGVKCAHGGTLFVSYAENKTPGAYRIFWCYDPQNRGVILVASIEPHPD